MSELLNKFAEVISKVNLRQVMLIIFLLVTSLGFLIQQLTKKKRQQEPEDLSQFEQDEAGLYPWETDIDDSPKRIKKDAKRYVNQHQPKRGKWR
ncbi:hypothetical protein [Enterococcus asini]|uniref:hypothetical protein n=1 Tax=Enterococcus asini TaxID=57732 RepID=UPI00241C59EF|nr:hypothetical protein [Enterococcus asini]